MVNFLPEMTCNHNMIIIRLGLLGLITLLLFGSPFPGYAQESQPTEGPIYIVQQGDSLWGIAARFGVSLTDLQSVNGINNANQLSVGDRLVIPGLEGFQGEITIASVGFGETARLLSRKYSIPSDILIKLNRLTGPGELFVGYSLVIPEPQEGSLSFQRHMVKEGQSLLEVAATHGLNTWSMVENNQLKDTWDVIPGDVLGLPGQDEQGFIAMPEEIKSISIDPVSPLQGKATVIQVETAIPHSMQGELLDHQLNFFSRTGDDQIALQGIHAMTEPGVYPLSIKTTFPDGKEFSYTQFVLVKQIDYPYDQPLVVDPATIDPTVTKPEDAQWNALTQTATPQKYWNGIFKLPSPLDVDYCLQSGDCWSSRFGNRRSYNGSPYAYFHTGLDVVGKTGTEIYAPADGVVVFAGPLTVRGNATMIDHGLGIYTGYMHQSEIFVEPGEKVKAGQLIGLVGGTGRVQGPHLHWEVWVGGIQVDPLDWLERAFP